MSEEQVAKAIEGLRADIKDAVSLRLNVGLANIANKIAELNDRLDQMIPAIQTISKKP